MTLAEAQLDLIFLAACYDVLFLGWKVAPCEVASISHAGLVSG